MSESVENTRFEPKEEFKKVRETPKAERKAALEKWKKEYVDQRNALAASQEKLIEKMSDNPNIKHDELVAEFKQDALKGKFSEKQEKVGMAALDILEERKKIINRVLEQFPTGRALYRAAFGIAPIGHIGVEKDPTHLRLVCGPVDYYRSRTSRKETNTEAFLGVLWGLIVSGSSGTMFNRTRLPELDGMLVVLNGEKPSSRVDVRAHEGQHILYRLLRSALQRVEVTDKKDISPKTWESKLQEYRDLFENRFANELLAQEIGGVIDVHTTLGDPVYFSQYFKERADDVQRQITALESDPTKKTVSGLTAEDMRKVLEQLNSEEFQMGIWKQVEQGDIAYQRLRHIGGRSSQNIIALLELEPLRHWGRLEIMLQGKREPVQPI